MKISFSDNTLYYIKIFGSIILIFAVFNYTWGYAQRVKGGDTAYEPKITVVGIDSVIRLKERTGTKLMLTWTVEPGKKLSHFVLERSADGRIYNEAALVFTSEDYNTSKYDYSEKIKRSDTSLVYYRLKAVNMEGGYIYAHVTASLADGIQASDQSTAKQK